MKSRDLVSKLEVLHHGKVWICTILSILLLEAFPIVCQAEESPQRSENIETVTQPGAAFENACIVKEELLNQALIQDDKSRQSMIIPDRINATFYRDTKTSKAFSWYAEGNGRAIQYIYYQKASILSQKRLMDPAKYRRAEAVKENPGVDRYEAALTGLDVDTRYYYFVGNENGYSGIYEFKTSAIGDGIYCFNR